MPSGEFSPHLIHSHSPTHLHSLNLTLRRSHPPSFHDPPHHKKSSELTKYKNKRHLKPGGFLEIQEFHYLPHADDTSLADSTSYRLRDFLSHLAEGLDRLGIDLHSILRAPEYLAAAGFSPTAHHLLKCPIGSWPKLPRLAYCGDLMRTAFLEGLGGYARRPLVGGLGWTGVQVEMLLVEVRKDVADENGVHAYIPFHVLYGQKPF